MSSASSQQRFPMLASLLLHYSIISLQRSEKVLRRPCWEAFPKIKGAIHAWWLKINNLMRLKKELSGPFSRLKKESLLLREDKFPQDLARCPWPTGRKELSRVSRAAIKDDSSRYLWAADRETMRVHTETEESTQKQGSGGEAYILVVTVELLLHFQSLGSFFRLMRP